MKLKHILLIEDDPDDADFFKDAVADLDKAIVVDLAVNGHEAIDILLKKGGDRMPDLIFMDINMPMMNGWETLKEIKRLLAERALSIVMFSSMNFDNVGFTAADLGALAFMTKPDSMAELRSCLRRLFNSFYLEEPV